MQPIDFKMFQVLLHPDYWVKTLSMHLYYYMTNYVGYAIIGNVNHSNNVFIVDNLTTAMSVLTHSLLAKISIPNAVILISNHTYNAVKLAIKHACRLAETNHGIIIDIIDVQIPFPILSIDYNDIICKCYEDTLSTIPADKEILFAIIDHITSVPALKLPIERIIPMLRSHRVHEVISNSIYHVRLFNSYF